MSLGACGLIDGSADPTRAPSTPLADETICGVFPNQDLQNVLGFNTYRYDYDAGTITNVDTGGTGYHYGCHMESNSEPFGRIEIQYTAGNTLLLPGRGQLEFDGIPEEFRNATRVSFEAVDGEGWGWTTSAEVFVAWRYNDNQVLAARLTYWGPEEGLDEQVDKFHAVLEPALAEIPKLASTTTTRVVVPSPTPEAAEPDD
ncbi:hypothetical protein [Actinomyces ruminis]|nr:hypothetical protein [Actinomyces ruminis]